MERERIASRRHAEVAPADKRKQPAVIGFADPATRFQWHAMVCTSPPLLPLVEQVRSVMSYASRLFWHAGGCPEMPALQGVSRGAQRAGQQDAPCSASAAQRPHSPPARVDRDNTANRATLGQGIAEPVQSTVPNEGSRRPHGRCYAAVPARSARHNSAVRQRVASRSGPFLRLIIVNAFLKWWVTA